MKNRGRKVLLIEYTSLVADVVGSGADDVWHEMMAPRHTGTLNVLFADGSVRQMAPSAIDPTVVTNHDRFWRPELEPTLAP